jgi:hypothetical protein
VELRNVLNISQRLHFVFDAAAASEDKLKEQLRES